MKEIDLFETWLNNISEAAITVLPTSVQRQQQLLQILGKPLPVGADGTNSTEELNLIFMTPHLRDDLYNLAQSDPNADARPIVLSQLSQYKNEPSISAILSKVGNETAAQEQPAPPTPAPGSEEAIDATEPVPPTPAPSAAEPVPPQSTQTGPTPPTPEPGTAPDELAQQPVAEAEYEYNQDLEQILKHAGVEPCTCPAEDYITGQDPHVNESSEEEKSDDLEESINISEIGLSRLATLAGLDIIK